MNSVLFRYKKCDKTYYEQGLAMRKDMRFIDQIFLSRSGILNEIKPKDPVGEFF